MKKLLLLMAAVLSFALPSFAETITLTSDFLGMSGNSYTNYTKEDAASGLTFKLRAAVNGGIAMNNNKCAYFAVSANKNDVVITNIKLNMATKGRAYVFKIIKNSVPFTLPTGTSGKGALKGTEVAEISTTQNSDGGVFDVNDSYVGFYQESGKLCSFSSIEITYESRSSLNKEPAGLAYTTTEFNVEFGDEFTAPELVNPNNLEVTYTSSNENVAIVDTDGAVTILAPGTTIITASSLETEEFKFGEASYTLKVVRPIPEGAVVDVLNAEDFGIKASYANYTYISNVTNIKYAAYAYSQNGTYFQIKTGESKSGIIVTENPEGYLIREILIEWTEPGMASKTIDVYVNDNAYTSASDLFSSSTQGEKAGTIEKESNIPLGISSDSPYVGIRSRDGAAQLTKITLIWEKPAAPVAPAAPEVTVGENAVTVTVEEGCTAWYKYAVVGAAEAPEAYALEADTWYEVENGTIDLAKLPQTVDDEKLQITVKAVNADGVESAERALDPIANPGGVSGITDIELGEGAAAEYYNLQGVRMNGELAPGLYIRRQGGKATKVVVK